MIGRWGPYWAVPAHLKFEIETKYAYQAGYGHTEITFCNEVAFLLGMVSKVSTQPAPIKNGWRVDLDKVNVTRNNLSILWVFADFVEQTMVGPHMLPLLRLVPVQQMDSGNLEHSMFSLQNYIPVPRKRIRQFGVSLHTHWNAEPLPMRGPVAIVLHFRKINV